MSNKKNGNNKTQGKPEPDFITFIAMCIKLQIPPDYIFGDRKRVKPNTLKFEKFLDDFFEKITNFSEL